jgi:hypothetical protein
MRSEERAITERATVEQYEPPVFGIERDMWVAEDAETGCTGIGRVEQEALGNLVSLILTHESAAMDDGEYLKLPGQVREKRWSDAGARKRRGLVERFFGGF